MTKEEKRKLGQFEARVRQLILQYKNLQAENTRLNDIIAQQESELKTLQTNLEICRNDYDTLKTARILEVSDNDITAARRRISKLVREVNKCIAILQTEGTNDDTQES